MKESTQNVGNENLVDSVEDGRVMQCALSWEMLATVKTVSAKSAWTRSNIERR